MASRSMFELTGVMDSGTGPDDRLSRGDLGTSNLCFNKMASRSCHQRGNQMFELTGVMVQRWGVVNNVAAKRPCSS